MMARQTQMADVIARRMAGAVVAVAIAAGAAAGVAAPASADPGEPGLGGALRKLGLTQDRQVVSTEPNSAWDIAATKAIKQVSATPEIQQRKTDIQALRIRRDDLATHYESAIANGAKEHGTDLEDIPGQIAELDAKRIRLGGELIGLYSPAAAAAAKDFDVDRPVFKEQPPVTPLGIAVIGTTGTAIAGGVALVAVNETVGFENIPFAQAWGTVTNWTR